MRRGERHGLVADGDVVVDARLADGELLLVALNAGAATRRVVFTAPAGVPAGAPLSALRGAAPVREGGRLAWTLAPRSTAIAVYDPDSARR
jgi:hypothetical protein